MNANQREALTGISADSRSFVSIRVKNWEAGEGAPLRKFFKKSLARFHARYYTSRPFRALLSLYSTLSRLRSQAGGFATSGEAKTELVRGKSAVL